jgi:hypothetical protein
MHALDRRYLLTGGVTIAGASLLSVTSGEALQPTGLNEPDPIFGVIERHRAAYAALVNALSKNVHDLDALDAAEGRAFDALVDTVPTTVRGLAALVAYVRQHRRERPEVVGQLQDRLDGTLIAALQRLSD